MARNTRLWQDPGATSISYEGDPAQGALWLGYAKAQLRFMLQNTPGPLSAGYSPVDGVSVFVSTRPNRIHVQVAGGDPYITVVDSLSLQGTFPESASSVPQTRKSRYLYKTVLDFKTEDFFYAGGKYTILPNTVNTVDTETVFVPKTGGEWRGKNGKALSWTMLVGSPSNSSTLLLFIAGNRYEVVLTGTTFRPMSIGYTNNTAEIISEFPTTVGKRLALVFGVTNYGSIAPTYSLRLLSLDLTTSEVLLLGSRELILPPFQSSGYGTTTAWGASEFSEDAKSIAIFSIPTSGAELGGGGIKQAVFILTFTTSYVIEAATKIYEKALGTLGISSTSGSHATGFGLGVPFNSSTLSLGATGEPYIFSLRTERSGFCALRASLIAASSSSNFDSSFDGSDYDFTRVYSSTSTTKIDVIRLPPVGSELNASVTPVVTYTLVPDSSSGSDVQLADIRSVSDNAASSTLVEVPYYSAEYSVCVLKERIHVQDTSQSNTATGSSTVVITDTVKIVTPLGQEIIDTDTITDSGSMPTINAQPPSPQIPDEDSTATAVSKILARGSDTDMVHYHSGYNNSMLLYCYTVARSINIKRTLLLNVRDRTYSKLNYRLDYPGTGDSLLNFYPITITGLVP